MQAKPTSAAARLRDHERDREACCCEQPAPASQRDRPPALGQPVAEQPEDGHRDRERGEAERGDAGGRAERVVDVDRRPSRRRRPRRRGRRTRRARARRAAAAAGEPRALLRTVDAGGKEPARRSRDGHAADDQRDHEEVRERFDVRHAASAPTAAPVSPPKLQPAWKRREDRAPVLTLDARARVRSWPRRARRAPRRRRAARARASRGSAASAIATRRTAKKGSTRTTVVPAPVAGDDPAGERQRDQRSRASRRAARARAPPRSGRRRPGSPGSATPRCRRERRGRRRRA